jgi:DNA-binding transcriptional ArsR family regulator
MNNRIRYTVEKVLSNTFYQMPKFLFGGEFKELSNDTRVLYMLLKDRHELSVKNEWYNKKGEVYLIMKRDEMEEMLNLSAPTIRKAINELKKLNLIEEERQGLNKPNLLYLLECKNLSLQNEKKLQSKSKENYSQKHKDFSPSNTNRNKNDFSKTDNKSESTSDVNPKKNLDEPSTIDNDIEINPNNEPKREKEERIAVNKSHALPRTEPESTKEDILPVYDYDTYKDILHRNIEYSHYVKHQHNDIKLIDELLENALDVITTQEPKVKINKELKNRQIVINKYLSLNSLDIDHIIMKFKEQCGKITHLSSYLKTLLYNVKQESNHYYTNAVRVDGVI